MNRLQTIIDLANQSTIKNQKQNIEISFSSVKDFITGKLFLVDGYGLRTEIAQIKFGDTEYSYDKAVLILEDRAVETLCFKGLDSLFNSPKYKNSSDV